MPANEKVFKVNYKQKQSKKSIGSRLFCFCLDLITFPSMFADTLASDMVTAHTVSGVAVAMIGAAQTILTLVTLELAVVTMVPSITLTLSSHMVTHSMVSTGTGQATPRTPATRGTGCITVASSPS